MSRCGAALRRTATSVVCLALTLTAVSSPAAAGSGYLVSAPLRVVPALASGLVSVECAVHNLHATATAHVNVVIRDRDCTPLGAADLVIEPGAHASAVALTTSSATTVTCAIDLNPPDNSVRHRFLQASFSSNTLAGQPRAALAVERHVGALPDCL